MSWESVIGLEIHVQLATRSKLFTAAPVGVDAPPNTLVDPVILGMPGTLPVLNREAVAMAIKVGLALGCTVHPTSVFARKHYFYPDLPKGYQISQFEAPICTGGGVWADLGGEPRYFELTRIHMEEDAGKTVHDGARGCSFVDYNRAGVALIETVSEPCMRTADEAMAYMKALFQVVTALGVCHGNMEQGNFRCDANVSVRPRGETTLGTKVELKNINSFRFVGRGITYEIERQIAVREAGGEIVQETRLWDDAAGVTRAMRTKEEAHDYRYFPDPDLMPIHLDADWVASIQADLPELPRARRARFEQEMGLNAYDADVLTQTAPRADYFEAVVTEVGDPKLVANWIQGELLAQLNRDGQEIETSPVSAPQLAELLELIRSGKLSGKQAKACFQAMYKEGVGASTWMEAHGGQITDASEIDAMVNEVLDANPAQVAEYLAGKEKLMGFFIGRVMAATKGRANPPTVNAAVKRLMKERK
ncbi:MAG: Asp-tRNA(Asn)/Glu-tRNA(Gln) amidotransferase subunit GatB [Myxococcota bacterium]